MVEDDGVSYGNTEIVQMAGPVVQSAAMNLWMILRCV
jgi:hypothetical protein